MIPVGAVEVEPNIYLLDGQLYEVFREIRHCPLCDTERWGEWSERYSRWKCDGCSTVFDYDAEGLL